MAKKGKKKLSNGTRDVPVAAAQAPSGDIDQAETQTVAQEEPRATSPPAEPQLAQAESEPPTQLEPEHKQEPTQDSVNLHQQIGKLQAQLETVENERDDIQDQYDELLDKVAHIKTTLGQRLKSDAAELARVREELEKLHSENETLATEKRKAIDEKAELAKKYDSGVARLSYLEIQLDESKEKNTTLESRVAQLSEDVEQQTNYAEHYRKSHLESTQNSQKLEEEYKSKVEQVSQKHIESTSLLEISQKENTELKQQLETLQLELKDHSTKVAGLDELRETVREKNILIGKLRHEAVILNEHLTNALRIVKKDSEGQTIDKELISNLIIQFVTIPRGDTKKFEALQLIASVLNWDEDRRVEAGISRSHQANGGSVGGFLGKFAEFMERESRRS